MNITLRRDGGDAILPTHSQKTNSQKMIEKWYIRIINEIGTK